MTITINNQTFPCEYMSTPKELAMGMMGRNSLDGCMIFKLTERTWHSFWMKGCKIPLDIVFVSNNKITKIHPNCPPPKENEPTTLRYSGFGDHVIEFPGGTCDGWSVGDHVNMYLGTPTNQI